MFLNYQILLSLQRNDNYVQNNILTSTKTFINFPYLLKLETSNEYFKIATNKILRFNFNDNLVSKASKVSISFEYFSQTLYTKCCKLTS